MSKGKEGLEMVCKVSMQFRPMQTWTTVYSSGRGSLVMGVLLVVMGTLAGSARAGAIRDDLMASAVWSV